MLNRLPRYVKEKYFTYFAIIYKGKRFIIHDMRVNGKWTKEKVLKFYREEYKGEDNKSILNFPNFIGCYTIATELVSQEEFDKLDNTEISFEVTID